MNGPSVIASRDHICIDSSNYSSCRYPRLRTRLGCRPDTWSRTRRKCSCPQQEHLALRISHTDRLQMYHHIGSAVLPRYPQYRSSAVTEPSSSDADLRHAVVDRIIELIARVTLALITTVWLLSTLSVTVTKNRPVHITQPAGSHCELENTFHRNYKLRNRHRFHDHHKLFH